MPNIGNIWWSFQPPAIFADGKNLTYPSELPTLKSRSSNGQRGRSCGLCLCACCQVTEESVMEGEGQERQCWSRFRRFQASWKRCSESVMPIYYSWKYAALAQHRKQRNGECMREEAPLDKIKRWLAQAMQKRGIELSHAVKLWTLYRNQRWKQRISPLISRLFVRAE